MHIKKGLLIITALFIFLMATPLVAQCATITSCTFDKSVYNQGETGYLTVTIYNDKDDKIRVTELTASVDYYYDDGNIYLQTFHTDLTTPIEIQRGESDSLQIPFSLPTNVASGYIDLHVKAKTELWNNHSEIWFASEHPSYWPTLYVESPYKQMLEDQTAISTNLQNQLQDLEAINKNTTNMMYLLGITTVIPTVILVAFVVLSIKARAVRQAVA